jgi:hypothetical protein
MSEKYTSARHDRILDEGVLIATSAVRMAVKNHLILRAVRDHAAFDRNEIVAFAAERFEELAAQEDSSAKREERRFQEEEWERLPRRRRRPKITAADVRRDLAEALRAAAADAERLDALVDSARDDALAEITAARHPVPQPSPRDPDDLRERADRLATLVAFDLSGLAAERGLSLEELAG